jgi:hypothetical protein
MTEKIVTEFLHDVVRKQNLDTYMRSNANTDSDWDNYVDPWGNVGLTELAIDWMNAAREQRERNEDTQQNIHYSGGPF